MRTETNEKHLATPEVGDFWHERFSPYLVVVQVGHAGLVVLDKTKSVDPDHYVFDVDRPRFMSLAELRAAVTYTRIPGFVADVVPRRLVEVAAEWRARWSGQVPDSPAMPS